jgi:cytochrome c biogenesis protein CcmG, thiol:disulfide interchange protein DsbE
MFASTRRTTRVSRLAAGLAALLAAVSCLAADVQLPPDLAQYRGQVLVIDFWASWCKPCRQSIPWLNDLRTRYGGQGLVIVGVNVDAERADADRFQRDVPISFGVLYDPAGKLAEQFGLQGMPTTFVFDRDGKLAHTLVGYREARRSEHEARILNLLKRKSS